MKNSKVRDILLWFKSPLVIFFAAYFIISLLFVNGFANTANLESLLTQSSYLIILSCGLTLVIINGGIDFSITAVLGLSSIIGAAIMKSGGSGWAILIAVLAMLGIGLVIGAINGLSVSLLKMPSFITTMATSMIISGVAVWYTKSETIGGLPNAFVNIGQGSILGVPVPVIVAVVIAVLAGYLLHGTVFGRYIMAIGTNQEASKISGVPVKKTIFKIFLLSGLFASIASVLMTSMVASGVPSLGGDMIMDIVAAVIIGGTSVTGGSGSMLGTVLGALMVVVLHNSLDLLGVQWFLIILCEGIMVLFVAVIDIKRNRLNE
jgi:ribose/xylose/arabinose/galactoside ABC-type transport system permease subunit